MFLPCAQMQKGGVHTRNHPQHPSSPRNHVGRTVVSCTPFHLPMLISPTTCPPSFATTPQRPQNFEKITGMEFIGILAEICSRVTADLPMSLAGARAVSRLRIRTSRASTECWAESPISPALHTSNPAADVAVADPVRCLSHFTDPP